MNLMIIIWVMSFIILLVLIYQWSIWRPVEVCVDWLTSKSPMWYTKA